MDKAIIRDSIDDFCLHRMRMEMYYAIFNPDRTLILFTQSVWRHIPNLKEEMEEMV
jgi:hypothetical protein